MIVSIHQPNYLPWMGLIKKIEASDIFVVFDDVQLPRGKSYTIRTKIKTNGGAKWITVPILGKSDLVTIKEIKINNDTNWWEQHWNKIEENYKNAPFFYDNQQVFKDIIFSKSEYLVDLNLELIKAILNNLKIKTKIVRASEFLIDSSGTQKIIELVKKVGADEYISGEGEGSKRYVLNNKELFEKNEIKIKTLTFTHPIYSQLHGKFVPNLSILDAIFNLGPEDTLKKIKQDED